MDGVDGVRHGKVVAAGTPLRQAAERVGPRRHALHLAQRQAAATSAAARRERPSQPLPNVMPTTHDGERASDATELAEADPSALRNVRWNAR